MSVPEKEKGDRIDGEFYASRERIENLGDRATQCLGKYEKEDKFAKEDEVVHA